MIPEPVTPDPVDTLTYVVAFTREQIRAVSGMETIDDAVEHLEQLSDELGYLLRAWCDLRTTRPTYSDGTPIIVERCDQGHEIEAWRLPPGFAHSTPPTPPPCQCYPAADATVLPFRPRSPR